MQKRTIEIKGIKQTFQLIPANPSKGVSEDFWMADTLCTQELWEAVMGSNPSHFRGPKNPVESVSYYDIQEFIKKLNELLPGMEFALPSEQEWEHACRAGTTTDYSFGDDPSELGKYAWYYENSGNKTHPVAEKLPNPWGLYDMHGNVWEWTSSAYREEKQKEEEETELADVLDQAIEALQKVSSKIKSD